MWRIMNGTEGNQRQTNTSTQSPCSGDDASITGFIQQCTVIKIRKHAMKCRRHQASVFTFKKKACSYTPGVPNVLGTAPQAMISWSYFTSYSLMLFASKAFRHFTTFLCTSTPVASAR
eukprot:scpid98660/ scgid18219/ 